MIRSAFILLIAVLFLGGCKESDQAGNNGKTVFRYNEPAGITSLDPAFASNQANIWACNQLFNGLVQLDETLTPQPCLARSWDISSDLKTYTFHLRTGVLFHPHPSIREGRTVKAADFVFSFQRICDEKTASPGAWVFQAVRKGKDGKANGFEAPDDSTFVLHLENPFPPMLGLLGAAYCAVVPGEALMIMGNDFRKNPVGTGPFLFHEWVDRTALVLHKNPAYFEHDSTGNPLPYLDAIMVSFINDKQSAFLEFLKGKLDFISGLDAGYKDDLLTNNGSLRPKYHGRFRMETGPYLNTEYLGIVADTNLSVLQQSPLRDIRIRKAINHGFDRKKMIRFLRNGMATAGTGGIVPPGIPGFENIPVKGYDFDPKYAARLLTEAGYPNGKGLPEITMSTTHSYQDLCEYIQGQLGNLGINIRLEINQAAQHRQMVAKQQLAFFRGSWIADYADAENYLSLFRSVNKAPVGPNYTHYSNTEFDRLYDQSMQTSDASLRNQIYIEMDSLMMTSSPVIVLYYDKVLRLIGNNVSGLKINSMNLLTLKDVKVTPSKQDD